MYQEVFSTKYETSQVSRILWHWENVETSKFTWNNLEVTDETPQGPQVGSAPATLALRRFNVGRSLAVCS